MKRTVLVVTEATYGFFRSFSISCLDSGFVCVFLLICIHAFPSYSWIHLTTQISPAEVSTVKGVPLISLSEDQDTP